MIRKHWMLYSLAALFLWGCSSVEQVQEIDDYNYKQVYFVDKETRKIEGLWKKFNPDGSIYESAEYTDGILNGERKIYFSNGNVEILENYQNGDYQGISKVFYENGTLKTEGEYQSNIAQGVWKGYYPNGQLKEEVMYADNQEEGPFMEWHENGQIKAEGTYKGGDNEHGELKLYDNNGQLERKMECAMGACSTIWKSDQASDET